MWQDNSIFSPQSALIVMVRRWMHWYPQKGHLMLQPREPILNKTLKGRIATCMRFKTSASFKQEV